MKKGLRNLLNSRQTGTRSVSRALSSQNQSKRDPMSAGVPNRYCSGGYHPVNLGDKFQDRYRVVQKLGFGVYSTVWLAHDESKSQYVALKVMTADALFGEKHIDELRILQRTGSANPQHPGHSRIVQLLDHFEHNGPHGTHLCLVMEMLGPNLSDIQSLYLSQQQTVPSIIVRRFLKQVLIGLDYLHRSCGIVHTDLQPNNVMIEVENLDLAVASLSDIRPRVATSIVLASGDTYEVVECIKPQLSIPLVPEDWKVNFKIADLGMGNFVDNPWLTLIQPEYLRAPEVILGCKWGTPVDIWSLGCIVFELLAGGIILFRSPNESDENKTTERLKMIVNLCGEMPKELIKTSAHGETYFNRRGRLRDDPDIVPGGSSLQRILERLKSKSDSKTFYQMDLALDEIPIVEDILRRMLEISPTRRATAEELIQHKWLQGV